MRRTRPPAFLFAVGLALSAVVAGCATGGTGGEYSFRRDIGKVMVGPLTTARDKVFGQHSLAMYRETDTSTSFMWEAQWMPRQPAPEESAVGATGARNRVIMRGTYVEERLDGTPVFRVRFEVENQIRTEIDPEWHPGPVPPQVEELFQEVYDDLMTEVRMGIIR